MNVKKSIVKRAVKIILVVINIIIFVIIFNPNIFYPKLLAAMLIPMLVCIEIVILMLGFLNWAIDGAKLNLEIYDYHCRGFKILSEYLHWQSEKIIGLYEIIQDNPEALKKIREQNPTFSLEAIRECSKAIEEAYVKEADFKKVQSDVAEMSKNLHPFRLSIYAIFVGISVGVALYIIGVIIPRIPLPK